MARLTGFEPVTTRLEGGCSIQLSYKRIIAGFVKLPDDVSLKLVGAQGFEPWTPCSQSRCATRLRHTPIIFSFVSYVVRYGVHSRRDSLTRQHLDLKKMKLTYQPSNYPPKALISLVFQRFRLAVKFSMRSKGSLARCASAGST